MTIAIVTQSKSNNNKKEMIGKTFNRWTVLSLSHIKKYTKYYKCQCICGTIKIVVGTDLRNNSSKSCGCLRKETNTKHGMHGTLEYYAWESIIQRCTNPNNHAYKDYGDRGIYVCKRWKLFENFFKDMGTKPKGLTIERIDNNKGYYKKNCCWATWEKQGQNRRLQKNNKTGITGVYWGKGREKYLVQIKVNKKTKHIGHYESFEEAKVARLNAEQKYWGKITDTVTTTTDNSTQ